MLEEMKHGLRDGGMEIDDSLIKRVEDAINNVRERLYQRRKSRPPSGGMVLNATQAVAMVNHVTGFDYDLQEVMDAGKRVWYLKRGLSSIFGARAEHDRLPRGGDLSEDALEVGEVAALGLGSGVLVGAVGQRVELPFELQEPRGRLPQRSWRLSRGQGGTGSCQR
jgi:hypothetical protein